MELSSIFDVPDSNLVDIYTLAKGANIFDKPDADWLELAQKHGLCHHRLLETEDNLSEVTINRIVYEEPPACRWTFFHALDIEGVHILAEDQSECLRMSLMFL